MTPRQSWQEVGKPWRRRTAGPLPRSYTKMRHPPTSMWRPSAIQRRVAAENSGRVTLWHLPYGLVPVRGLVDDAHQAEGGAHLLEGAVEGVQHLINLLRVDDQGRHELEDVRVVVGVDGDDGAGRQRARHQHAAVLVRHDDADHEAATVQPLQHFGVLLAQGGEPVLEPLSHVAQGL